MKENPSEGRGALIFGAVLIVLILGGMVGRVIWEQRQEAQRAERVEELLRLSRERPVLDLRSGAPTLAEEREAWEEYQRRKRDAEAIEEEARRIEALRKEADALLTEARALNQ